MEDEGQGGGGVLHPSPCVAAEVSPSLVKEKMRGEEKEWKGGLVGWVRKRERGKETDR